MGEYKPGIDALIKMRVQDLIRETDFFISKGLESYRTRAYLPDVQLLAIKQSQLGPECFFRDRQIAMLTKRESDVHKLCNFVTVGVGQGDNYNEGLYGPLPVLSTGWGVLVYARMLSDTEFKDVRMKERNYVLICVLYNSVLEARVIDRRQEMERIIEVYFEATTSVQDMKRKSLMDLKRCLLDVLAKN